MLPTETVKQNPADLAQLGATADGGAHTARRLSRVLAGLGEDDEELVAAVADDHVGVPNRALRHRRDLAQHHVARRVAVVVVDLLEPVYVDHQESDGVVMA